MWWSRSFLGRQEAKYQKCSCWGSYTGNQSSDFSSLQRLRVRSTQRSNTLAPIPAIATSKSMVLEGFWVMFYKVYRSLIFKILSFRKTTPNLINMKMIPLEKQLITPPKQLWARDIMQLSTHKRCYRSPLMIYAQCAVQTWQNGLWIKLVLQSGNKWEKKSTGEVWGFTITKPCHIDVTIRWNYASFKYNFIHSEIKLLNCRCYRPLFQKVETIHRLQQMFLWKKTPGGSTRREVFCETRRKELSQNAKHWCHCFSWQQKWK